MEASRQGTGRGPAHRRPVSRRPPAPAGRQARDERGASLVEFAFVVPILFTLVFGIIDFGLVLSDTIGVRQGVREAARQGTVADFGTTTSCSLKLSGSASTEMKKLMCLTKARSDVPAADLRVAIRFDPVNSGLSAANAYPAGTGAPPAGPVGNGLVVCAITPMTSRTGFFGPVMSGRYLRSRVVMRIEKGAGTAQSPSQEVDPSGANWSWCTS